MILEQTKHILEKNYPELHFDICLEGQHESLTVQWYELSDSFDHERRYEIIKPTPIVFSSKDVEDFFSQLKSIIPLHEYLRYSIDSLRMLFEHGRSIVECNMIDYVSYTFIPKTIEELINYENNNKSNIQ